MSAKYSRLPTSDPDAVSLSFDTIHKYESNQDYGKAFGGYGRGNEDYKSQFKSAFTYSGGFDPRQNTKSVGRSMFSVMAVETYFLYLL